MSFLFRRAAEPAAKRETQSGVPLEFIRWNGKTFELGNEALDVLQTLTGPVAVCAVAGRARQGKSYLLNQLLGQSGGFRVAPTHRPCTKGLWMWSAPVKRIAPDGTEYALILLDTEGIDAFDQTGQYSTQIFTLSVLLSSLFVFNQLGGIDEAALDRLSLVTEMTHQVRVRSAGQGGGGGAEEDARELAAFTPAFVWLLRDFFLKLEEDGRTITPRDYLETALQPINGTSQAVKTKNQIRESIKTLFPDRDCFALVRPVNEEDQLAQLDALPPEVLRPEFRRGLAELTELIFRKAQPKRLGAQVLNGPILAALATAYVRAINSGAVPSIASAWQGVAEIESRRAADDAEAAWAAAFSPDSLPADEMVLESAHQAALLEAQKAFDAMAIGDVSIRAANDERWKQMVGARYTEVKQRLLASAAAAVERALGEGAAALATAARAEDSSIESVVAEVKRFEVAYRSALSVSGPTKWPRFAEFMRDNFTFALLDVIKRQEVKKEAALLAVKQRVNDAEARAVAAEGELGAFRQSLATVQGELAQARRDTAQHAERTVAAEAELRRVQSTVYQEADSRVQAAHAQVATTSAAHAELARQVAQTRTRLTTAHEELERLRAHLSSLEAEKTSYRNSWEGAAAKLAEEEVARRAAESQLADAHAASMRAHQQTSPQIYEEPTAEPIQEESPPDIKRMTMEKMKAWLMENGYETEAWELANRRAKKGDWEALMKRVIGQ